MIERLTRALVNAGLVPEPGELADVLWLATQFAGAPGGATLEASAPATPTAAATHDTRTTPTEDAAQPKADRADAPIEGVLDSFAPVTPQFVPGSFADGVLRVRGVATTDMPCSLTRPLQAFARRLASPTETMLDEEATAEHALETGVWAPVLHPSREYAFDLLLVIEETDSSPLWADSIAEFVKMLSTQTAFQRVHELRLLNTDTAEVIDTHGRSGPLADWRAHRTAQVVLVSDTLSPLWREGRIDRLLRSWHNTGPLTLLQPMPRRTWRHLPMGMPSLSLSSYVLVRDNDELFISDGEWFDEFPSGVFALPVIGFDDASLRSWAAVMTGRADVSVPGMVLVPGGVARRQAARKLSGPERVALFRQMASQAAYDLAVHLSVMEQMTIPLMRLIQRFMHPDSGAGEMAEVFLGGLLEPVDRERVSEDRRDRRYRFIPDVREVLITSRRRSDELRIDLQLRAIDDKMPPEQQTLPVMSGYFRQPKAGQRLTDWVLPFRPVSRELLHRHAGRRVSGVNPEQQGGPDRDREHLFREIVLQRPAMKRAALASNYALSDDEVLDDLPLVVSAEESIWIVGLMRHLLFMRRQGSEAAEVAATIPVEQVALVEARADSAGRGQLHFHQLNHMWEFDTRIWRNPFDLQLRVNNLGMLGQKLRTDRMLEALRKRSLVVEQVPPNEVFWKLDIETSRDATDSSPEQWGDRSLRDALPGWLYAMQPDMTHTYRAPRANTILQIASMRLEGGDEEVFAIPMHVPRPLTFVHFKMSDVDAITSFAKDLYLDRGKVLWAVKQGVRALWKDVNGISWINPELENQTTYSFFAETFDVGDLEYGNPMSPSDLGSDAPHLAEESDQDDIDLAALANALTEAADANRVRGLSHTLEKEIREAVERADWDVDATSSQYYETDDIYAMLQDWEFGGPGTSEFEPVGFDNGILTVTRQIIASVEVHCAFEFSVKDGIDKDMVYTGSAEVTRDVKVAIVAEFGFSGLTKARPSLEWVEIQPVDERVDFGHVEPDYDRDEFNRDDDERR